MKENFKQAQVYIDQAMQDKLKLTAMKNNFKVTNQGLTELAYIIATRTIDNLEVNDLEQITNLKFK